MVAVVVELVVLVVMLLDLVADLVELDLQFLHMLDLYSQQCQQIGRVL
jgi:hypothetical protein